MPENKRKVPGCYCIHKKLHKPPKKKEQCKKKRQTFVYNPEEDMWHEPYMRDLRKEFSDVSILCDSKIELPWKDIALPVAGMKIRQDASLTPLSDPTEQGEDGDEELAQKESEGTMPLPWKDLIITETVPSSKADPASCDSTLEIPWNDLVLEPPVEIRPVQEEACVTDDVEIPWDDILLPRNIVIESQPKKHPSSKYPPRSSKKGAKCCCASVGCKMRMTASCK
ncbi:uncharacterized protein LOC105662622 [Megachile rotundata]|uniref:uncharacterized protein LOC105662622 n=1 Tax=Megachile rotundata TaxID=143995 RepID=UPI000614D7A4|nr:PREDICTED: uncharacterized protein LOC105662622 [Megachile rotundata]XP_012141988.1 PREDICTED: uncharacterized protein LOC105662622 [Megachile rotundata]XP_012141989.1 PREDICTED: uncharacterized protein LOC105662622 [Megachile rotundata]XP_012141990.1 PREDICTED: uncharacterized protein LOC105662622 [Megachile rotundata]